MRKGRRKPTTSRRGRPVPAQSRVTVRRTVAALRRGRSALESLEKQLGDILSALADGEGRAIDKAVPDRLGDAVRAAAAALATVPTGPAGRAG